MSNKPIYLDHAATTPTRPEVIAALTKAMKGLPANASSAHKPGRQAAARVAYASQQVADSIGAEPDEIIWTSGATEATNLALKGVVEFYGAGHLISEQTEHHATLDTLSWLEQQGSRVTLLGVNGQGAIDLQQLQAAIDEQTRCVSITHVNNETGAIQDIAAIGQLCKEKGVLFHVDAAQSYGKLDIDVGAMQIDLLSVSGHKFGGTQGSGFLYQRRRTGLRPQMIGGGQQQGRRSGTLPVPQIIALGEACQLAQQKRVALYRHLKTLREKLWQSLQDAALTPYLNTPEHSCPHILNFSLDVIHGSALLAGLIEGEPSLAVSAGSACSAAQAQSSYVLRAMGRPPRLASTTLRLSLGWSSEPRDIERAAKAIKKEIARLLALTPPKKVQDHVTS